MHGKQWRHIVCLAVGCVGHPLVAGCCPLVPSTGCWLPLAVACMWHQQMVFSSLKFVVCNMVQVREQQAQQANEAQVGELRDAVKAAQDEAAELHERLATVVPRDQLTAAEQRIKVCSHQLTLQP